MSGSATIPFIDAHVHLWELGNLRYSWLMPPFGEGPAGPTEAIAVDYGLDAYLADAKHWDVRGIVHIDAGAHPDDALPETHWLQAMADKRGMPNGIVAFAALNDPKIEALLAAHAAHKNVRGIRHIVGWHPDPAKTYAARDVTGDADWQSGFALLKKFNLSFDCQVYPSQLGNMAALIARHPETMVILNHLGMPILADSDGEVIWREGLQKLAALPNTCIKLSGVGFIHRRWTMENIRRYVLTAIELFGPARCLFASDFPTDKLFDTFDAHLNAYHAIVADFSEDERRDMFGRNANRVYRLGIAL